MYSDFRALDPSKYLDKVSPGRTATIVVAAADASLQSRAQADFVCGAVDSQEDIQRAINALPASGGKISLSEGSFDIADEITLPSNIEFAGQGWSTVLTYSGPDNAPMITANVRDNILIHSMKLDGGNLTSHILNIRNVNGFEVHSMYLTNPRQVGGLLYTSGIDTAEQALQHGFIHHNYLDCNSRGQALYATVHAFDITYSDNVIIEPYDNGIDIGGVSGAHPCHRIIFHNNIIYKSQGVGYGVSIRGNSYNIIVTDNYIYNTQGFGVRVLPADAQYPRDIIIHGNRIDGVNSAARDGIAISARNDAGHISIRNNQITVAASGRYGILIDRAFKFDITDNMILDCPDDGIHLTSGQGKVCDNQIYSAGGHGIFATGIDNSSFNGNRIEDATNDGMYIELCDYCTINGNVIDNPGSEGIHLASSMRCTINGNAVHSSGASGINLPGGDHNVVSGNVVEACGVRGISVSVDYCVVDGNRVVDTDGVGIRLFNSVGNIVTNNFCTDTGVATQTYGIQEAGTTDDYNIFKGNYLRGNTIAGIYIIGVHDVLDQAYHSIALDLTGGATDIEVFHANAPCKLAGYTILYSVATGGGAGVNIRVGRYQDGVALDDDYFDVSVSELNKAIGYSKHFVSVDLTQTVIAAGDTVTVGTAGGKADTGEVILILKIVEMAD